MSEWISPTISFLCAGGSFISWINIKRQQKKEPLRQIVIRLEKYVYELTTNVMPSNFISEDPIGMFSYPVYNIQISLIHNIITIMQDSEYKKLFTKYSDSLIQIKQIDDRVSQLREYMEDQETTTTKIESIYKSALTILINIDNLRNIEKI